MKLGGTWLGLAALLLLGACEGRSVGGEIDEEGASTGADASSGGAGAEGSTTAEPDEAEASTGADDPEGGTGSSDSDTGEIATSCSCVEMDLVCGGTADQAFDCPLPDPCPRLEDDSTDPTTVECVLQLLIAQAPARFAYRFGTEDFDVDLYEGWFYILGVGEGLDNECHVHGSDFAIDHDPAASSYSLQAPPYFEACLGGSPDEMRGCLLDGLETAAPADACND